MTVPELRYELYRLEEAQLERRLEQRRMLLESRPLTARWSVWSRLAALRGPRVMRAARIERPAFDGAACCVTA